MNVHRRKHVTFAVAVCAAGLFFTRMPAARAEISDADRDFVRQATEEVVGDAEINRVARTKAEHEEVRHYAAERVKMDEQLESELRDIADRHHIAVPGKGELAQAAKDRIEHLGTAEHFDREYLSGEVRDSEEMTKLFTHAAEGESDRELRKWFEDKQQTLKDRHVEVKTLDDRFDK
jgi:predicted outer membrane protein